jgi:hypothetical protein
MRKLLCGLAAGILVLFVTAGSCRAQSVAGGYDFYNPYAASDYGTTYTQSVPTYDYLSPPAAYANLPAAQPVTVYQTYNYYYNVYPQGYGAFIYTIPRRGYSGPGYGLPPVSYGIAAPAYYLAPVSFGIAPAAYGPTTRGLYAR